MNCERCFAPLDDDLCCPSCGAKYTRVCCGCGRALGKEEKTCPDCGGIGLPGLDMTRGEMARAGLKCFMPYTADRVYRIYLGGNLDGGGYVFHNAVGYTHNPPEERVVLPSLVEGNPIYSIWNEFFAIGEDFLPENQPATYARMMPIREIVVSSGIQEAFTYAFFGCASLSDVYYTGTEAQWDAIVIQNSNEPLLNATRHYS